MIRRAVAVPAAVLSAACLIAGCSSSGSSSSKSPSTSGGSSSATAASGGGSSSGAASTTTGSSSAPAADASSLAGAIATALAKVTSVHIGFSGTVASQQLQGSGDETLSAGTVKNFDLSITVPGAGEIAVIKTGGTTYAKLPAAIAKTSKPWVQLSTTSSNPVVARLATTLDSSLQAGSLQQLATFVSSVSSVQKLGTSTVDGTSATQYRLTVSVAKLPSSFQGKQALQQAGLSSLPIVLYLDSQNRPVQFTEKFSVAGQSVDVTGMFTKYDQPVTISAPPASQVGTS